MQKNLNIIMSAWFNSVRIGYKNAISITNSCICALVLFFGVRSVSFAEDVAVSKKRVGLAKKIADSYIRSFPSERLKEDKNTGKGWNVRNVRPPRLGDAITRSVLFNSILEKSEEYEAFAKRMSPILNQYAWGDLKLFYGSTSAPRYHLMAHINRTVTVIGEGVLATLLVTPVTKISELEERQTIVKTFAEQDANTKKLRDYLKEYQDAENSLLSLWTPTDPIYTREYRNYMQDKFYAKYGDPSNKRAGWLELKKRCWRDFFGIQLNFTYPIFYQCLLESLGAYNGRSFLSKPRTSGPRGNEGGETIVTDREYGWTGTVPIYGPIRKIMWFNATENPDRIWETVGVIGFEAIYAWRIWVAIENYLEFAGVLNNLAIRMADVQAFVRVAAKVSDYIEARPELEKIYGNRLTSVRKLLARANENSEFGSLMAYLQTLPYKSWSYFFNSAGKLLASHMLFTEYKDEFADAMFEIGQLDAYLSVATMVREANDYNPDHCFTYTKFLDRNQKSRPYVKLTDMWNPFLDSKVAVGNDLTMDANGGIRNITLTGPNAGGKSTFLTGVTGSILLSQSFGIAPAKEAVVTPFDKINTYIDVMDDIASGKSLFMAEVDRAQQHINLITSLKPDEFSFTIFDEPFSGTNPTEGAAAKYSILEALGEHSNSLNIVATHYPIVMLLEERAKDKGFANYKVYIMMQTMADRKRINYTYKIIPGKSNQAIAIDILEEQGYDTRLLKEARDIIQHPEKYMATFK